MGHVQRLIAFDLDGTLIDSRRDLADSANQLIAELGGAPLPEAAVGRMVGDGARVLVERALAASGLADPGHALPRFLAIYDTRLLNHTRPYPGVEAAIEAARRGARVTMLTNKPLHHTARIVDALGWAPLFDEVVGGDNPLGRKPEPHALLAMMSAAGVAAAQAMLVGDSKVDLDTARRAGVRCCLVSFGYGFESVDKAPIEGETIVKDVATLVREIEAFVEGGL
ncbi:MAG TPA: HAD-IA family hydrolase [Vicinamibacterales bacterium]|nr:HAD-IA family hydrolase [Vicinamibacterales bacterium]